MNFIGGVIIVASIALASNVLRTEQLFTKKWIVSMTILAGIATLGILMTSVVSGIKVLMVVFTMLMSFLIVMKSKINIFIQVAIQVLLVFVAIIFIALINKF